MSWTLYAALPSDAPPLPLTVGTSAGISSANEATRVAMAVMAASFTS